MLRLGGVNRILRCMGGCIFRDDSFQVGRANGSFPDYCGPARCFGRGCMFLGVGPSRLPAGCAHVRFVCFWRDGVLGAGFSFGVALDFRDFARNSALAGGSQLALFPTAGTRTAGEKAGLGAFDMPGG